MKIKLASFFLWLIVKGTVRVISSDHPFTMVPLNLCPDNDEGDILICIVEHWVPGD